MSDVTPLIATYIAFSSNVHRHRCRKAQNHSWTKKN